MSVFRPCLQGVALVAVTLNGLIGVPAIAGEIGIVRDGVAQAYILIAPDAHPLEREAATDLQESVRRATGGGELKLLEASDATGQLLPIRIGRAGEPALSDTAKAAWKTLPYDGAIVEAGRDGVIIAGPTPAGTANGVATVLMEDVGVRTYYPDPLFTIVPRSGSIQVRSRVVKPSFDYRVWSGVVGSDAAAYHRHSRLSDGRIPVPYFGFGHNLGEIIPVEKYGKDHPEYFAYRGGVRRPEGSGVGDATQPCFTNPEVIRLTIEAARKSFDEHPDRDTFSLCVNDNPRYCECEACSILDKPYRDLPVGRQYSESYYDYVAKVAEAIAQSHPDRYLGVYAYWNVEQPPRNRQKLPDNVIPALTLDILQHYDPAYRDKDRRLIQAWSGYVKRLHTYVYYGLGWYTPRTSPGLVAEDLRFCAGHGVRAIYCEAYPFWAWCGPMHYVAARLQWNVNEDVDRVLEEFHRDCFEDVAAQMRAFHEACERYWTRSRSGRWFEGLDRLGPEEAMADLGVLHEAQKHLESALNTTKTSGVRQRVAWIQKGFDFTMAMAEAFQAKKAGSSPEQRIRDLVASAGRVKTAYGNLAGEPAYRHAYYMPGPRFENKCWRWFEASLKQEAATRWSELNASSSPQEARSQWDAFLAQSGLGPLISQHGWDLGIGKGTSKTGP